MSTPALTATTAAAGYQLRRGEAAGAGIRRIGVEQIDCAIDALDAGAASVHAARKCCKRLRGLLRLARFGLGEDRYRQENEAFRDAARALSDARDADAVLETLAALAAAEPDALDFAAVADVFRPAGSSDAAAEKNALSMLRDARLRVADWRLDGEDFAVIGAGLAKTYDRGRQRLRTARANPSVAVLHEWRKRVKYHWYHIRLLEPVWPGPMAALRNELKRLSDGLGDDHDLAVLRTRLPPAGRALGAAEHARLLALIDARRDAVQADAFDLGRRVYAEPARRLEARLYDYWRVWRFG